MRSRIGISEVALIGFACTTSVVETALDALGESERAQVVEIPANRASERAAC